MTIKPILLFDLGGVIVPWVGIEALMQKTGLGRESIINILAGSKVFNSYETGKCNDTIFLSEMVALFDYDLSSTEFASLWNSWVKPPYPNTLETLSKLKENYTLACLSNTNALHWAHLNHMFNLSAIFDYCFASHTIKVAKPDPHSFQIPLDVMKTSPEQIIFFDDTEVNVLAARRLGITTHLVNRDVGVIPTLAEKLPSIT